MAARKKKPQAARKSQPKTMRIPRGGLWRVSLCAGGNRWRTIPGSGSHAEADYIADGYRRHCQRVAVHRLGQPPRERTAPVLPLSYRPPSRDNVTTIQELLTEFVRTNDKASAIVLNDALIEDGYDWAAFDLRDSLARGCRERRGLAERILSEVLNDSTVLEHGEWDFRIGQRNDPKAQLTNTYVLIREQTPVRFRGGTRSGTRRKREPRLVIWSRSGSGPRCRWRLYGSYPVSEFGSLAAAERTARIDIADRQRSQSGRAAAEEADDYEPCGDCGFDHSYEYPEAHAWHTANPGSYSPGLAPTAQRMRELLTRELVGDEDA